jgi:hypothetical protein
VLCSFFNKEIHALLKTAHTTGPHAVQCAKFIIDLDALAQTIEMLE